MSDHPIVDALTRRGITNPADMAEALDRVVAEEIALRGDPIRKRFGSLHDLITYACDESALVSYINRGAYLEYLKGGALLSDMGKRGSRKQPFIPAAQWWGSRDPLPQVGDMLMHGWADGVKQMRETLAQVKAPRVQSVRRRARWTDQGDTIDMPRVYAGHIETAWRACKRVSVQQPPRVRLVCDVGVSWTHYGAELFWRGACATALAEALCAAGYAVEITSVSSCYKPHNDNHDFFREVTLSTLLKPFDAPFSINTICAALAHAAAFRRIYLAARCLIAPLPVCPSMGRSWTLRTPEDVIGRGILPRIPNEVIVVVPGDILDNAAANRFLAATVAALESPAGAVA